MCGARVGPTALGLRGRGPEAARPAQPLFCNQPFSLCLLTLTRLFPLSLAVGEGGSGGRLAPEGHPPSPLQSPLAAMVTLSNAPERHGDHWAASLLLRSGVWDWVRVCGGVRPSLSPIPSPGPATSIPKCSGIRVGSPAPLPCGRRVKGPSRSLPQCLESRVPPARALLCQNAHLLPPD